MVKHKKNRKNMHRKPDQMWPVEMPNAQLNLGQLTDGFKTDYSNHKKREKRKVLNSSLISFANSHELCGKCFVIN